MHDDAPDWLVSRRHILQLAAYAVALPGASAFFGTWLEAGSQQHTMGTQPPEPPLLRDYVPKFFDAQDFEALQALTAILIPTDDTPGAREARCAHFIDFVLQASTGHAPETQAQWRSAMRALRDAGFHTADAAARAAMVQAMSRPEREPGAVHPAYAAYRLIKQQNTFAFYTSRAGIIECLDYRGNAYNASFPGCDHPEHRTL
ncbi:MAG: gluconate 2-dehydrogenase subunit 3 family protein [Catenulispora sp.]